MKIEDALVFAEAIGLLKWRLRSWNGDVNLKSVVMLIIDRAEDALIANSSTLCHRVLDDLNLWNERLPDGDKDGPLPYQLLARRLYERGHR